MYSGPRYDSQEENGCASFRGMMLLCLAWFLAIQCSLQCPTEDRELPLLINLVTPKKCKHFYYVERIQILKGCRMMQ